MRDSPTRAVYHLHTSAPNLISREPAACTGVTQDHPGALEVDPDRKDQSTGCGNQSQYYNHPRAIANRYFVRRLHHTLHGPLGIEILCVNIRWQR